MDALDKPVIVDKSDSNDNAIAKLVAANLEYLLFVVSIGNKLFSGPMLIGNQMWFSATTKHTIGGIIGTIVGISIGFIRGNGVGFDEENSISSARKVDVDSISIGSNGNNSVGFVIEISADGNPGDVVVCLGALSAIVIDPTSFWFNIAALTSFTTGHGHFTLSSFVVQVGQVIKPSVLLF